MLRPWFVMGLMLSAACGPKGPSASETLPRLREAIAAPVSSEQANLDNSALVEQVTVAQHLDGLPRSAVETHLGRGDKCAHHPMCREQGFNDGDWYYEVGARGDAYVGPRPVLIVGFDRFGKVVRTYNLRVD